MSNKQSLSFATAYEELKQLTSEFEQEELDLEAAIPKFKRAAELSVFLKKKLTELDNKIEEINVKVKKDDEVNISKEEVVDQDIDF